MRVAGPGKSELETEPRPLADGDDGEGELLRAAGPAYLSGLAENAAWHRFERRRNKRQIGLVLVPVLACLGLLLGSERVRQARQDRQPNGVVIAPERVPVRLREPSVLNAPPPATEAARQIALPNPPAPAPRVRPARITPRRDAQVPAEDATCRRWSSEGHLAQAVECFQAAGRGSDLAAEVALYEAARLSGEGLHDAARALALLEQHRLRFPQGALRGEVEWLRVRSLERTGRFAEALKASEDLLASPLGRPLSPKLHLLRGRIYERGQSDCAHAVTEYVALLGEPGAEADEAELGRAQCLERLGRAAEARDAYQRYLTRQSPRGAALATERLQAIALPRGAEGRQE